MKRQVIVTPEAEQDMTEAFGWYEDRITGLGHAFLQSMDSVLGNIIQSPLQFPLVFRNTRRALMRRFPHEIFFVLKVDRIIILAVYHAKRNPKTWQQRIDDT